MAESSLTTVSDSTPGVCRTGTGRLLVQTAIILLSGAAIGLIFNLANRSGIPLKTPDRVSVSEYVSWSLFLEGIHVTIDEAKRAYDAKNAVFVDARSARAYEAGHIPGAIRISSREVKTRGGDLMGHLPRDAYIVTYCGGGSCQASIKLAGVLKEELGFTRIGAFYGGWDEWMSAGFPSQSGIDP